MNPERVKTLIVGGGVSGLCAALALPGEALILEKEAEAGGYCRSFEQDGFLWDCAGHFFHFADERGERFFRSLFEPGELVERRKNSKILYGGRLIDYPFQANLHQLDKSELLDCLYDLLHREEARDEENLAERLCGLYGAATLEKFLRPYNEKLYACQLEELAPDALGRFLPRIGLKELTENWKKASDRSYNSCFLYPRRGAGAFIERLLRRLPPNSLRCGRSLLRVDAKEKLAIDSEGGVYRYDSLVSTAPLPRLLAALGRSESAASLHSSSVLVLNLGFERKAPLTDIHWIYVPGREAPFYRLGFYDNILGGDRASLYLEIAVAEDGEADRARKLTDSLSALRDLGLIQPDNRLLSHQALLLRPAYVQLRPGTAELVQTLRAELERQDIYSIGRYGAWSYRSMEDCVLEALALGERLGGGKG